MTTTRTDRAVPRHALVTDRDEYPTVGTAAARAAGLTAPAPRVVISGNLAESPRTHPLPAWRASAIPVSPALSPTVLEPASPTTRESASSPGRFSQPTPLQVAVEPLLLPTPLVMPHEVPLSARTPIRAPRAAEAEPRTLPSAPRWHPVDPRAVAGRLRRLPDEDEVTDRSVPGRLDRRRTALVALSVLTVVAVVLGLWRAGSATLRGDAGAAMPTVTAVSALPAPASGATALPAVLSDNPTYARPIVGACDPVATPTTAQEAEAAISAYVSCMNTVWSPIIGATTFPFNPASVKFFGDAVSNSCATITAGDGVVATYCPLDSTIYVSARGISQSMNVRFYAQELVTHEYAHHVQSLTQVLVAAHQQGWNEEEYNRRIQLQAHCLSFAVLTHVTGFDTDVAAFRSGWAASPGSATYGSTASLQLWGERGLAATTVGACQTFTAPAAEVA